MYYVILMVLPYCNSFFLGSSTEYEFRASLAVDRHLAANHGEVTCLKPPPLILPSMDNSVELLFLEKMYKLIRLSKLQ
jgi:hypothetical protein